MPGDERKFKRRRIVAFMPACKREREFGASHTSALDGMPGTGVAVSEGATVDEGVFVGVGDEIGTGVAVAVADGKVFWMVAVSVGFTAPVDAGEAEARAALVGVEVSGSDAGITG